jgi:ketosteroid isomerase-like protein
MGRDPSIPVAMPEISADHLATVLDTYDAIKARDLDRVLRLFGGRSMIETRIERYEGADAVRGYFTESFKAAFEHEQEGVFVRDDVIVAVTRIEIFEPGSGTGFEECVLEGWTFEPDGGIHLVVTSLEEGLEQHGLREQLSRVRQLRDAFRAMNAGDHAPVLEFLHQDAWLDRAELALETPVLRGRRTIGKFLEPDVFESQNTEVEQVVLHRDRLLIQSRFRAKAAGSGIELANRSYQVWLLRDWKAVRGRMFQERDDAFALLFEADTV